MAPPVSKKKGEALQKISESAERSRTSKPARQVRLRQGQGRLAVLASNVQPSDGGGNAVLANVFSKFRDAADGASSRSWLSSQQREAEGDDMDQRLSTPRSPSRMPNGGSRSEQQVSNLAFFTGGSTGVDVVPILRKIAKKSATTRLKGIQELVQAVKAFEELAPCKDKGQSAAAEEDRIELIQSMMLWIPEFCRVYHSSVLYDSEADVRYGLNVVLARVVNILGDNFRDYLFEVFAMLWLSGSDPSEVVAEAAAEALNLILGGNLFSEKSLDILSAMRGKLVSELVAILSANELELHQRLYGAGAATQIPATVREERYDRLIQQGLLSLARLVHRLCQDAMIAEEWRPLLTPFFSGTTGQGPCILRFLAPGKKGVRFAVWRTGMAAMAAILEAYTTCRVSNGLNNNTEVHFEGLRGLDVIPFPWETPAVKKKFSQLCLGVFSFANAENFQMDLAPRLFCAFCRLFPETLYDVQPEKTVFPHLLRHLEKPGGFLGMAEADEQQVGETLYHRLPEILSVIPSRFLLETVEGVKFLERLFPALLKSLALFRLGPRGIADSVVAKGVKELVFCYFQCAIFLLEKRLSVTPALNGRLDELREHILEWWFWAPLDVILGLVLMLDVRDDETQELEVFLEFNASTRPKCDVTLIVSVVRALQHFIQSPAFLFDTVVWARRECQRRPAISVVKTLTTSFFDRMRKASQLSFEKVLRSNKESCVWMQSGMYQMIQCVNCTGFDTPGVEMAAIAEELIEIACWESLTDSPGKRGPGKGSLPLIQMSGYMMRTWEDLPDMSWHRISSSLENRFGSVPNTGALARRDRLYSPSGKVRLLHKVLFPETAVRIRNFLGAVQETVNVEAAPAPLGCEETGVLFVQDTFDIWDAWSAEILGVLLAWCVENESAKDVGESTAQLLYAAFTEVRRNGATQKIGGDGRARMYRGGLMSGRVNFQELLVGYGTRTVPLLLGLCFLWSTLKFCASHSLPISSVELEACCSALTWELGYILNEESSNLWRNRKSKENYVAQLFFERLQGRIVPNNVSGAKWARLAEVAVQKVFTDAFDRPLYGDSEQKISWLTSDHEYYRDGRDGLSLKPAMETYLRVSKRTLGGEISGGLVLLKEGFSPMECIDRLCATHRAITGLLASPNLSGLQLNPPNSIKAASCASLSLVTQYVELLQSCASQIPVESLERELGGFLASLLDAGVIRDVNDCNTHVEVLWSWQWRELAVILIQLLRSRFLDVSLNNGATDCFFRVDPRFWLSMAFYSAHFETLARRPERNELAPETTIMLCFRIMALAEAFEVPQPQNLVGFSDEAMPLLKAGVRFFLVILCLSQRLAENAVHHSQCEKGGVSEATALMRQMLFRVLLPEEGRTETERWEKANIVLQAVCCPLVNADFCGGNWAVCKPLRRALVYDGLFLIRDMVCLSADDKEGWVYFFEWLWNSAFIMFECSDKKEASLQGLWEGVNAEKEFLKTVFEWWSREDVERVPWRGEGVTAEAAHALGGHIKASLLATIKDKAGSLKESAKFKAVYDLVVFGLPILNSLSDHRLKEGVETVPGDDKFSYQLDECLTALVEELLASCAALESDSILAEASAAPGAFLGLTVEILDAAFLYLSRMHEGKSQASTLHYVESTLFTVVLLLNRFFSPPMVLYVERHFRQCGWLPVGGFCALRRCMRCGFLVNEGQNLFWRMTLTRSLTKAMAYGVQIAEALNQDHDPLIYWVSETPQLNAEVQSILDACQALLTDSEKDSEGSVFFQKCYAVSVTSDAPGPDTALVALAPYVCWFLTYASTEWPYESIRARALEILNNLKVEWGSFPLLHLTEKAAVYLRLCDTSNLRASEEATGRAASKGVNGAGLPSTEPRVLGLPPVDVASSEGILQEVVPTFSEQDGGHRRVLYQMLQWASAFDRNSNTGDSDWTSGPRSTKRKGAKRHDELTGVEGPLASRSRSQLRLRIFLTLIYGEYFAAEILRVSEILDRAVVAVVHKTEKGQSHTGENIPLVSLSDFVQHLGVWCVILRGVKKRRHQQAKCLVDAESENQGDVSDAVVTASSTLGVTAGGSSSFVLPADGALFLEMALGTLQRESPKSETALQRFVDFLPKSKEVANKVCPFANVSHERVWLHEDEDVSPLDMLIELLALLLLLGDSVESVFSVVASPGIGRTVQKRLDTALVKHEKWVNGILTRKTTTTDSEALLQNNNSTHPVECGCPSCLAQPFRRWIHGRIPNENVCSVNDKHLKHVKPVSSECNVTENAVSRLQEIAVETLRIIAELFPCTLRKVATAGKGLWMETRQLKQLRFLFRGSLTPHIVEEVVQFCQSMIPKSVEIAPPDPAVPPSRITCHVLWSKRVSLANQLRLRIISESEEVWVEAAVEFPDDYPLRSPNFSLLETSGVPVARIERWLLESKQLLFGKTKKADEDSPELFASSFLDSGFRYPASYGMLAALLLFRDNAAGFIAGLEDCAICYAIVHTRSRVPPRKKCATCKHKFHAECLDRWFQTSYKTKCPLCQSDFY